MSGIGSDHLSASMPEAFDILPVEIVDAVRRTVHQERHQVIERRMAGKSLLRPVIIISLSVVFQLRVGRAEPVRLVLPEALNAKLAPVGEQLARDQILSPPVIFVK